MSLIWRIQCQMFTMDVPPFPGFREIRMWILQFINTEETSDGTKILNTSVRVHLWHTSVQTFRSSIKWVQQSSLNAFLVHYLRPLKAQLTTNEMQGNIKHYHARCSYKSINLWLKKKKNSAPGLEQYDRTAWWEKSWKTSAMVYTMWGLCLSKHATGAFH